jgi:hypothetical protein
MERRGRLARTAGFSRLDSTARPLSRIEELRLTPAACQAPDQLASSRLKPAVRAVRLVALVVAIGSTSFAQDSRPDAARRLHELVDRRIDELRAELHREIDAALKPDSGRLPSYSGGAVAWGISVGPVSDEFRYLHRIAAGEGIRVIGVSPVPGDDRLPVKVGDVVLRVNSHPIRSLTELEGALAIWSNPTADVFHEIPVCEVIRNGERTEFGTLRPLPATETAAQMVDRLWDEAVRNAIKTGVEEVRPGQPVPESQPARK